MSPRPTGPSARATIRTFRSERAATPIDVPKVATADETNVGRALTGDDNGIPMALVLTLRKLESTGSVDDLNLLLDIDETRSIAAEWTSGARLRLANG